MSHEEIVNCAEAARQFGYGTLVVQAGEDPQLTGEFIAEIIKEIKDRFDLAVTLSLGERSNRDLLLWRQAGADRYLLRFETSNRALFNRIHPALVGKRINRLEMLARLSDMGYEIGSGVMCGIPGQSFEDLARDIQFFARMDLDMIGVGPYIPHPATPLAAHMEELKLRDGQQAPHDEMTTYKVVALARLVCPQANIPSTTALATLNLAEGRELGLKRGANVLMPNITPVDYRKLYEIYPAKACIMETAGQCRSCMKARVETIGRTLGSGPGGRRGGAGGRSSRKNDSAAAREGDVARAGSERKSK